MTNEQFDLLLKLTSIRSDGMISACRSVLVDGLTQKAAAAQHDVNEGQLSRRLAAIREVDDIARRLSHIYL